MPWRTRRRATRWALPVCFFSSRRRHTRWTGDWSSDVCSSDLAQFRFESYTTPTTLYADPGDGRPVAIKSLPARFDASNLMTEQFFATSRDGTQIPYLDRKSVV